jgi:hypothetical protein
MHFFSLSKHLQSGAGKPLYRAGQITVAPPEVPP